MKISIIVPAYNAEQFISRSVLSLINQTIKDIEIIIIDDGSTDNTFHICEHLKMRDKRIVLIHQDNAGVSAARNKGIEIAKGDYIGFVDSDDYADPEMYEGCILSQKKLMRI